MYQGNLKAEMARRGIMVKEVAALLVVKSNTVSGKLKKPSNFTFDECEKIRDKFFPEHTIDYLFVISE